MNEFDYRDVKRKIKKGHSHVHWFEDIWVECIDEEDIQRMDLCRLTMEQIRDLGLEDFPEDFEDLSDILDSAYHEKEIAHKSLPLIQWSKKENISIWKRLAPILYNTSEWLQRHGF